MGSQQATPPNWAIAFHKILDLEEAHGFDNNAVVGGMDQFVQRWSEDMARLFADPSRTGPLLRVRYGELAPAKRQLWASHWRELLRYTLGVSVPATGPVDHSTAPPDQAPEEDSAPKRTAVPRRRDKGAPAESRPASKYGIPPAGLTVDAPLDRLRGVDSKLTARFQRLDVATIRDLLYLFPRRYNDYSRVAKISELEPGREFTVVGQIWEAREVAMGQRGRLKATEAVLSDDTGNVKVIWFGQRYLARSLKPNSRISISGKVDLYKGQMVFESPEYDLLNSRQPGLNTGRLAPVYPLTEGLTGRNLRRLTWQAINDWLGGMEELLPQDTLERTRLAPLLEAISQAHYPEDEGACEAARRRLAFDELLTLQLAVLSFRRDREQDAEGVEIRIDQKLMVGFLASLPFALTEAQARCLQEILEDLGRGTPPMNRLLQGEVGSGKTVVVLAALLAVAAAGYQGAIMVPTEVLAEQHFQTVQRLFGQLARPVQEDNLITAYVEPLGRPITVGLLTGSTRQRPRRQLVEMAAQGSLDLLVGTHALIQDAVDLPKLALAVMDEQHRFGVRQRSALRQRGDKTPHSLVMSATPIPRTLSLTIYGDLDISTIDQLPPGRQQVRTRWVGPERRQAAYGFLRKQVAEGRQAFIIYPLIDESEAIDARAATEDYQRLTGDVFPDLRLGLLHGRMSARDKDRVMRQFRDGEVDILVSTAVVEVGIDVPNATVMLIEGADRFGLSQLHQFRGRVGRGEHTSYCLLVSDSPSETARERLAALEQVHDGFHLAEVDLELRGPGDFFGTRQSGLPNLRMAQLSDRELLNKARAEASRLMEEDSHLAEPKHAALKARVGRFLAEVTTEFS